MSISSLLKLLPSRKSYGVPPAPSWIKINTDGASITNPLRAVAAGIFRNSEGACIGGFSQFLGYGNALFAELYVAMTTIELAASNGFTNIWLESDSQLVIQAFKSKSIVPWGLKNRWDNCIGIIQGLNFCASHIYREGNVCADSRANFGLSLASLDLFGLISSLPLLGESTLGIGWECLALDSSPFEKVLV